ncbi:hypothetical protein DMENIID0001_073640 [Sergentomyia squamirostris]
MKEINDVFEQLNHKTHGAKDEEYPYSNNTEANNVERREDNKLQSEVRLMKSDDLVIKEADDSIAKRRDQREKRCDHTTNKNELRSMETSILPYPKDGERAMINEWADSVMREFDELVEGEKKPAPGVNRRHHQQWNEVSHRATHFQPKRSTEALVNGRIDSNSPSPVLNHGKLSSDSLGGNFPIDEKDTVLKIDEELIDEKREISTQTSPKLNSIKKEVSPDAWTSEESILRGTDTVDEDNKSTSSSAGEDVSAALSSGKSGNSLNSSVDDSAESGLGTASSIHGSASRKLRPYIHQISQKSVDDKNTWIRYENATTQTGRIRPVLKLLENNASFVSTDDPDLLEVLSLYDDNNAEDDEFAISDSETSSRFQDDVTSEDTKSEKSVLGLRRESHEEDDVMLRRRQLGDCVRNVKCLDRVTMSVSYGPSVGACKTINNTSVVPENQCNSLPLTRRVTKERHFPLATNNTIDNMSDSALPTIKRRPFCLPVSQESFHTISQLPSPSTTSLHSGGNRRSALMTQELTTKSNSAPMLMKKEPKRDGFTDQTASLRYSRSQSDRYLAGE